MRRIYSTPTVISASLFLCRIYAINDSTYYVTYSNYQGLEICRSIVFAPQKQMWWKTDYGLDIQHKTKISTQSQKFSSSTLRMNSGWFFWHDFILLNLIHLSCVCSLTLHADPVKASRQMRNTCFIKTTHRRKSSSTLKNIHKIFNKWRYGKVPENIYLGRMLCNSI